MKKSSPVSSSSRTIGVSTNFLKQFVRQYLTNESEASSLTFEQCVSDVIVPRTQEGKCCVAQLEERYKDSKGNGHSGVANTMWLYSRDMPLGVVMEEAIKFDYEIGPQRQTYHFMDLFCENFHDQSESNFSLYQDTIEKFKQEDFLCVLLDDPLYPFFARSRFSLWVIHLALRSRLKVRFICTGTKMQSRLMTSLADKYEQMFLTCEQAFSSSSLGLPARGERHERVAQSTLKSRNAEEKARLGCKSAYVSWVTRKIKAFLDFNGDEGVTKKKLFLSYNAGSYFLGCKNAAEAKFFFLYCDLKGCMVNSFFDEMSGDVTLKLAQTSAVEGLLETAIQVLFHEIEVQTLNNRHYPRCVDDFFSLAVSCNTHLGYLEEASDWCKKLANHRHLNLEIAKDAMFDSFSTLEQVGQSKNPEQFSDLQRRYRSTLDNKQQVLLAQIECAESFSLLGELFMRLEDYQQALDNFTIASRLIGEAYGKVHPWVSKSKNDVTDAKIRLKESAKK